MTDAESVLIVAMQECSHGNASIGSEWIETAIFPGDTPVYELLCWADGIEHADGRLMLSEPDYIKGHPPTGKVS